MKTVTLEIDGIMCVNCVNKITMEVGNLKGINEVAVSGDFSKTTIKYMEDQIELSDIVACIEAIPSKNFIVIDR